MGIALGPDMACPLALHSSGKMLRARSVKEGRGEVDIRIPSQFLPASLTNRFSRKLVAEEGQPL